jgi:hypothetical protein
MHLFHRQWEGHLMRRWLVILVVAFFLASGIAWADPGISQVPETQNIRISCSLSSTGVMKEDQELTWLISTGVLDSELSPPLVTIPVGNGLYLYWVDNTILDQLFSQGVLGANQMPWGETQYSVGHSEQTTAREGSIDYDKEFSADTSNKAPGTSNIESVRGMTFTSDSVGRLVSSENLVIDGAGQYNPVNETRSICPFGSASMGFSPAFCNKVEMGSSLDLAEGSARTSAAGLFVTPTSDYPVSADYAIRVNGIDDLPADGSVSAYMQAQLREGRSVDILGMGDGVIVFPPDLWPEDITDLNMGTVYILAGGGGIGSPSSELFYEERTTAAGLITSFVKDMHYESGAVR